APCSKPEPWCAADNRGSPDPETADSSNRRRDEHQRGGKEAAYIVIREGKEIPTPVGDANEHRQRRARPMRSSERGSLFRCRHDGKPLALPAGKILPLRQHHRKPVPDAL